MTTVLAIGGFDPSAGAGVLADIKTIRAFGCYGLAVVTSLTFQNTLGVAGASNQSRETVASQLAGLLADFQIDSVKTGMLPTRSVIEEVAEVIAANPIAHVVVDPVFESTSGFKLVDDAAVAALVELLFPLASVITPNTVEAERLTGIAVKCSQDKERAAQSLLALGPRAVIVKGGHEGGVTCADLLLDREGVAVFTARRLESSHTHGTGCTFASALACLLGRGNSLRDAIPIAKQYLADAILAAPRVGHGSGPVGHPAGPDPGSARG
jgi:hydroxymethylpyrimidine kinase/phosphomethylpyrimidine kinase